MSKAKHTGRAFWFWMNELGQILDGATDEELERMRNQYVELPRSRFVLNIERKPSKKSATVYVVPLGKSNLDTAEEIISLVSAPPKD